MWGLIWIFVGFCNHQKVPRYHVGIQLVKMIIQNPPRLDDGYWFTAMFSLLGRNAQNLNP